MSSTEGSGNESFSETDSCSDSDDNANATTITMSQAGSSTIENALTQSPQSQRHVLRDPEDAENLREPVAGTSTGIVSRVTLTNLSQMSSPVGKNKRKPSGTSNKSPLSKKRTKSSQSQSGSSSSNNGDTIDNLSPGNHSDDLASEDDFHNKKEKKRRTTQHFSIHRLPVEALRKRFNKPSGCEEEELIESIIHEVNQHKMKRGEKFEKITVARIPSGSGLVAERDAEDALKGLDAEDAQQRLDFKLLFYRQFAKVKSDIKAMYHIPEKSPLENLIWFLYRSNDIYAMTIRQTWQLIQVYSCYEFPCKISERLTDIHGSTQEILFHLTGNVSASQSVKKNPMKIDRLNSVVLNIIKPLRADCSLYGLKEFQEGARKKVQVKVQIGLGYIRIKKRMDHKNLPEILGHFTNICEGKPTYTFPGNDVEKQLDDLPYLHCVFGEVEQSAKNELYKMIVRYVRNQDQELTKKFYLCDVFRDDFYNAEDYKMTCYKKTVATFKACPTLIEIFEIVKNKWGSDIAIGAKEGSQQTFANRIKKNIQIVYRAKGSAVPKSRPLLSLLEGEMTLEHAEVWKLMGKWMVVRDNYYYQIHMKFLNLLEKGKGGLFKVAKHANLTKRWDVENVKSVKDYCKMYETETGYFLPPPPDASESNERHEMTGSYFFDMMKVSKDVQGKHPICIWIYYIFDRFDSGIRDASMRISKSLEMVFPKDGSALKDGSLLAKFWNHQNDNFKSLFGNYFESFCDTMTTASLKIVVGFATQFQELNARVSAGMASQFLTRKDDLPTLKQERKLKLEIPEDEFIGLIHENVKLDELYGDLGICPLSNLSNDDFHKLMATKVLEKLVERGYFTRIVSDMEKFKYRVTGSFLKLRKHEEDFHISDDIACNQKYATLLRRLQQLCTSGFPGFTHKLEIFQIHESISKDSRIRLYITEILC